jgi:hypothetical protein
MWLRLLVVLALGSVLMLLLSMLAADGVLGRYGWTIALIVGSAVSGGFAGGFVSPRMSVRVRGAAGKHPTPHS